MATAVQYVYVRVCALQHAVSCCCCSRASTAAAAQCGCACACTWQQCGDTLHTVCVLCCSKAVASTATTLSSSSRSSSSSSSSAHSYCNQDTHACTTHTHAHQRYTAGDNTRGTEQTQEVYMGTYTSINSGCGKTLLSRGESVYLCSGGS
jgi:hypothetical protein